METHSKDVTPSNRGGVSANFHRLDLRLWSDYGRGVMVMEAPAGVPLEWAQVRDADGRAVDLRMLRQGVRKGGGKFIEWDAAGLVSWSPENPVLYSLTLEGVEVRFGHTTVRSDGRSLLINGVPRYLRGCIRGIEAHDHPNLTGLSKREFFRKNIGQAKRYGFNLVRFHTMVPDEEFVELADEMGFLVHMEIGYRYEYDAEGRKSGIQIDEDRWRETILKFRNHPSVLIFCLGNEMHRAGRNPEVARMVALGRDLAPGKLILDNAGWGEFDRDTADVFIQHVAYYFPHGRHARMFEEDFCWENNGSVSGVAIEDAKQNGGATASVRRGLNPVRPVLAHECAHYIDIPDYEALRAKFEAFVQAVGHQYIEDYEIERPRYLDVLPALIAAKGIQDRMPDAIAASRHFKKLALKTYFERLRASEKYAGFEMLQLSDCLKYENKNGLLDCFDDDKGYGPAWVRQFNDDVVLLAEFPAESFWGGESVPVGISLSNFAPALLDSCVVKLFLQAGDDPSVEIYQGAHFRPVNGLSRLVTASITPTALPTARRYTLAAELHTREGQVFRNAWDFFVYPRQTAPKRSPVLALTDGKLEEILKSFRAHGESSMVFTDVLDGRVLDWLGEGRTVLVNYHRDREGNTFYLPGALDRFKPCIWDRGSHLGGMIRADWLREAMGSGLYFDKNFHRLVDGAYKVNLDLCPFAVEELVSGFDKPVRDRMKGLVHGVKDFLPSDTLRNFCYLFRVGVGEGILAVCTFDFHASGNDPASHACLAAILGHADASPPTQSVTLPELSDWLDEATHAGPLREDVMNHFWELDNLPVETKLFWEEARVDLAEMRKHS